MAALQLGRCQVHAGREQVQGSHQQYQPLGPFAVFGRVRRNGLSIGRHERRQGGTPRVGHLQDAIGQGDHKVELGQRLVVFALEGKKRDELRVFFWERFVGVLRPAAFRPVAPARGS